MVDKEIIKRLPKSFQKFYEICREVEIKLEKEIGDEKKNGNS